MSRSHAQHRSKKTVRRAIVEQLENRHLLASDFLLEIEGIKGESSDARHPNAIEIQSFSWGASNPSRLANQATTEEFRFVTDTNSASPLIALAAAQGKLLTKATLYSRKAGEGQPDYMKVEMKEVFISSYQSRSLNEELPKDEVAFKFSTITQQVTGPSSDGTPGETVSTTWSIPRRTQVVATETLLSQQPSPNVDQSDVFLLIDGIKGESADQKYRDAIPIESFSWGVSQTGGARPRASIEDMRLVGEISKASPVLARAAATGKHFPEATLIVRRTTSDAPQSYIKITLSDILISSYSTAAGSGTAPMEEIQIRFSNLAQSVARPDGSAATMKFARGNALTDESDSLIDNTVPEAAASDFLLEIDGIKGESAVSGHKGAIHVDSFSWGVSQTGVSGGGGGSGGGAGKVSLQDFHFKSSMNSSSPLLAVAGATGKHISKAVLTVRKSGERPVDYLKIELEDLLVSSYQAQGLNNQIPTDQFSLSFDDLAFSYQPPAGADGQAPVPIKIEWDAPNSVERVPNTVEPFVVSSGAAERSRSYFIKFRDIEGDATNKDHKGELEVLSWSWGVSQSGIRSTGSGLGAGKASFQDFHFVSKGDKSSPKLIEKVFSSPSPEELMTLSVRADDSQADYLKLVMARPDLTSFQLQGLNDTLPLAAVSLNFAKITYSYKVPGDDSQAPITGTVTVRNQDDRLPGENLLSRTTSVAGASDYFLKLGGIKGESTDAVHKGSIDVQSFSWGVTQHSGQGGGSAGKVSLQDFHFVMESSSATPQVLRAFAQGKHFPDAVLTVRKSQSTDDYIKITLKEVLVTSYATQGDAGSAPQEEIALNFLKLDTQVTSVPGAAPVASSFDFSRLRGRLEFEEGESILSASAPSKRAADYFLKIDGIKGESTDRAHKDWIDILSFSWGASNPVAEGRRLRGIKFEGLSFNTDTDTSSPQLLSAYARGNRIPSALLEIRTGGGQGYIKYELRDVLISSYSLAGSESDDTDFTASFGRLNVSASSPPDQNAKGDDVKSQAVDIYYTDQDEFIAAKRRR